MSAILPLSFPHEFYPASHRFYPGTGLGMPRCSYATVVGIVYMMPSVHVVLANARLAMHKENK